MSQIRRRARSPAQKQVRADRILDAAGRLESERGFPAVRMADVARAAGVAKGTVFLYFPTKESLGLALLERQMAAWFDGLDASLAAPDRPATARAMAHHLAGSVADRPTLARMLSLLGSVLERNVEADRIRAFKRDLLARLRASGAAVERALPFLARGDGLRLLLFLTVVVAGLQPVAEPAYPAQDTLSGAELAPLRIDFHGSLESVLRVHIEGMRALRQGAM